MKKLELYIEEATEKLWLYQVEDAVLMVEVMPAGTTKNTIGQVVLKRLITAEQVINRLCDPANQSSSHFSVSQQIQ